MKKTTIITLGIATFAIAAGGIAFAKAGHDMHHGKHGANHIKAMFAKADSDGDKSVSSTEFNTLLTTRFDEADANKDGTIDKGEAVNAIEKQAEGKKWMKKHAGRMADNMMHRFDINEDGKISKTEMENRSRKMFALADWNDDGKVETTELQRVHMGMMHGKRHGKNHDMKMGDEEKAPSTDKAPSAN